MTESPRSPVPSPRRTDGPIAHPAEAGLPTLREILGLPAVAAGLPELLVDAGGLDASVRWVHVSDSAGVARLLDGGELLLTTGAGWPAEPAELTAFVAGLVEAGLAGLVLELGVHYRYTPAVIVDAARHHGLPLVVLHREVKFVALTEAVHRRIISEQTAALRARDEVREQLTELALRGAPADFIVHRLAQTLGAPVVLENLAHEVVTADLPADTDAELLADWERRSRLAHRGTATSEDDAWLIVPVEARGVRWGRLIALPGPDHPAGRASVLEQGAIALAVGRLADGASDDWARIARERLLDELLAGRFGATAAAEARVAAAGFPVAGARLVGLVVTGRVDAAGQADAAAGAIAGRALAALRWVGPDGATASAGAARSDDARRELAVVLSLPPGAPFDDRAATEFARALAPGAAGRLTLWIGAAAEGLEGGLASLRAAGELAAADGGRAIRRVVPGAPGRARDDGDHGSVARIGRAGERPMIRRVEDRPLIRLVSRIRDDHRVLEHGEHMLAPLVEHDQLKRGDLLEVLGAVLAHPANRTAAASASHLSRSVFYQRLAQIEELLGVDLDDGETQTALHLALLVRRAARP
jgi:purine catabolism regulator